MALGFRHSMGCIGSGMLQELTWELLSRSGSWRSSPFCKHLGLLNLGQASWIGVCTGLWSSVPESDPQVLPEN